MKTLKLIVFGMMILLAGSTQGQISVRLNIGTPPQWGPAGYNGVRYYYLPDIECYYDVQTSMFIYPSGNGWVHNRNLPGRYRNYDLYNGYKVVMNDYRGNAPYTHFREYRTRYAKGYHGREQHNIGERHDNRGRGREGMQSDRMGNRGNDRNFNQNNGRDDHQNNGRMNQRPENRGNDRGHGNDRGQGNDKNNNEGHDNGNRK